MDKKLQWCHIVWEIRTRIDEGGRKIELERMKRPRGNLACTSPGLIAPDRYAPSSFHPTFPSSHGGRDRRICRIGKPEGAVGTSPLCFRTHALLASSFISADKLSFSTSWSDLIYQASCGDLSQDSCSILWHLLSAMRNELCAETFNKAFP